MADRFGGQGALKTRGGWYRGLFEGGLKHGKGNMKFNSGDGYEGTWAAGRMAGQGVYVWKDGRRHEGEWDKGTPHGLGATTYPNGEKHDGMWHYGKRHGVGVWREANGAWRCSCSPLSGTRVCGRSRLTSFPPSLSLRRHVQRGQLGTR